MTVEEIAKSLKDRARSRDPDNIAGYSIEDLAADELIRISGLLQSMESEVAGYLKLLMPIVSHFSECED